MGEGKKGLTSPNPLIKNFLELSAIVQRHVIADQLSLNILTPPPLTHQINFGGGFKIFTDERNSIPIPKPPQYKIVLELVKEKHHLLSLILL